MAIKTPAAWPTEEIEWFASTAYNHSVDLRLQDDAEASEEWARMAMTLAHYCNDGGHLEVTLQDMHVKYKLDAE